MRRRLLSGHCSVTAYRKKLQCLHVKNSSDYYNLYVCFFIQFTALTSCDQSAVYVNAHLRCNPKPEHFQCHAFQLLHIILRGLAHIFSAIKQFCSNIVSAKALLPVKGKLTYMLTWAISGLPADALINWAYSETSFLFYIAAAHVGKKVLIAGT